MTLNLLMSHVSVASEVAPVARESMVLRSVLRRIIVIW